MGSRRWLYDPQASVTVTGFAGILKVVVPSFGAASVAPSALQYSNLVSPVDNPTNTPGGTHERSMPFGDVPVPMMQVDVLTTVTG